MSKHLLVRAARGETVERPPVWAMRQAGRWDPEFNRLRSGMSFYEFANDIERSAQASILPRRFGVDGIILFYDITTLPMSMGLDFSLQTGRGPVPAKPIRTLEDVHRLDCSVSACAVPTIRALLRRVKEQLKGELPVLVFAGAPFTVASYCIDTGKDMDATRRFASEKPEVWKLLLQRLSDATVLFLKTLIRDGADVYQLFDSWAGLLTQEEYGRWAQPYHRSILENATGIPRILFVKECPYFSQLVESGADIISLGKCHDLARLRQQYPQQIFQGNVDEAILRQGTPEQVREATLACMAAGGGQRHIVNLNHGVDRTTPVANMQAFINTVRGNLS